MNFLIIISAFIFGIIIGSFLNVLILRLPKGETINGRSHCMHCKHVLHWFDLVPLFSYLFLRGKCRYCKHNISKRYFYIESATGILFAISAVYFTPIDIQSVLLYFRIIFIISVLILIFMIDLEHFLILDKIVLPASIILLAINLCIDLLQHNLLFSSLALLGVLSGIAIFIFFGGIYFLSRGAWIGFGDVKFSFFLGLATPFPFVAMNIFLAYVLGAVLGVFLILFYKKKISSKIPFGTFLAAATLITIFYGAPILNWYARAVGIYGVRY